MTTRGVNRFLIFGIISSLGAVIDFIVGLALMTLGFPPFIALACAMCLSATLVYIVHQKRTFADIGGRALSWKRLTGFLFSTFWIYVFRLIVYHALYALGFAAAISLALALTLSVIINYTVSRFLIFSGGLSR